MGSITQELANREAAREACGRDCDCVGPCKLGLANPYPGPTTQKPPLGPVPDRFKRTFATGATRDQDLTKYDFEGFLSPVVLEAFAAYMHKNRQMADGSLRDSDNWQKGIPMDAYMKSAFRHFFDAWKAHRGYPTETDIVTSLLGLLFNVQGYVHEYIKAHPMQSFLAE